MNFLAHIYLSGEDEFIQIGNFIADGIKGKKYLAFPQKIQEGILLHREIDSFTDHHPVVRQSTKRLHPNYSHYSGVVVDMFYDHFLAKNWKRYSDIPLEVFAENFYRMLQKHHAVLPERTRNMIPHMIRDNWLVNYASLAGIDRAMTQLNRRTDYQAHMNEAINDLREHYPLFEKEFTGFFEELIIFTKAKLREGVIKTVKGAENKDNDQKKG
ncbi:acyl carrier protein phosphodiesterase [Sinomicrobium kalidii]|uniref:acyl carrier protein phosphodiesterase n=1 Tax=Sinomicrobium kalidii TaxID=2900738 RepID=UPI001E3E883C|nr:acyl carrier protein phosphodiesterase [Sinomicrobium kalidii]UGU16253.1 acyl carrier protein phosphodiesterase [Sinomicrobium kalidii]